MTVAEVERYAKGALARRKEKAQFDYVLADLIGVSSARVLSKDVTYPSIEEVYPHLFSKTTEEVRQEQAAEIATRNSVNRFLEFAQKHNSKMKKGESEQT